MAGVLQKAMVWLGLAPDDEYDDYPYEGQARPGPGSARPGPGPSAPAPGAPGPGAGHGAPERRSAPGSAPGVGPPRPQPRAQGWPGPDVDEEGYVTPRPGARPGGPTGSVRQLPGQGSSPGQGQAQAQGQGATFPPSDPRASRIEETPTVRPMRPSSARPAVLDPESFDDAKEIADRFKADQPVLMDLAGLDRELSRRLIDFASGICYALGGHMERVRTGGYLLTPAQVEVSDDDKRRLAAGS
ncbi:MAG: cell division protein SepF [Acidimicrobiales bacterium]|nr:cell division protein SepF [Acidimicrobiales bacterium]